MVRPAGLVDGPMLGAQLPVKQTRFIAGEVDRVIQFFNGNAHLNQMMCQPNSAKLFQKHPKALRGSQPCATGVGLTSTCQKVGTKSKLTQSTKRVLLMTAGTTDQSAQSA